MRIVVGYGNSLRGEDAFGLDVIDKLYKFDLENTRLISIFQLTPELSLKLLEADYIIFVDAFYSVDNHYKLLSPIEESGVSLSHHISYKFLIGMLNILYSHYPKYEVFSMGTNRFDDILNRDRYDEVVSTLANYLK